MIPKMESQWVKIGSVNTHYIVTGDGPPLVLVNGGGASTAEKDWAANLEALSRRHRVYAPDMVGFGKSDKPKFNYTQELFIGFLQDFISAVGLERFSLIGHSMGGGAALGYTLNNPQKVDKLVLIDSSGLSNNLLPLGKLLLGAFKLVAKFKKDAIYVSVMTGGGRREVPEVFMDRLGEIQAPTFIFWGGWDGYMSVNLAREAHKRLPNSRLHIFKRGWHAPHRKHAETFNRLVLEFLNDGEVVE